MAHSGRDTETLTRRVADTAARDVVLTPGEEAAYHRLVDRINRTSADGSGLDRFLC